VGAFRALRRKIAHQPMRASPASTMARQNQQPADLQMTEDMTEELARDAVAWACQHGLVRRKRGGGRERESQQLV